MGNSNVHNHKRCPLFLARPRRRRAQGQPAHQGRRRHADGQRDARRAARHRRRDIDQLRRQHGGDGSQCSAGTTAQAEELDATLADSVRTASAAVLATLRRRGCVPGHRRCSPRVAPGAGRRRGDARRRRGGAGAAQGGRRRQRRAGRRHDRAALGGACNGDAELAQHAAVRRRQRPRDDAPRRLHAAAPGQPGRARGGDRALSPPAPTPTRATATGATPLMLAARSGSTRRGDALLENGADINATETANGQTALMFAAGLDRAEVVKLLLARGADAKLRVEGRRSQRGLTAPSEDDRDADATAARPRCRSRPRRRRVGRRRASTRAYRYNELIGTQGGLTALHFAARQGAHGSRSQALVDGGADVNQPSPGDKATPLLDGVDQRPLRPRDVPARARRRSEPGQRRRRRRRSTRRSTCSGRRCRSIRSRARTCSRRRTYLRADEGAARQGRRPERARQPQGLVLAATTSTSPSVDEIGATAVLARRLRHRRRRR